MYTDILKIKVKMTRTSCSSRTLKDVGLNLYTIDYIIKENLLFKMEISLLKRVIS